MNENQGEDNGQQKQDELRRRHIVKPIAETEVTHIIVKAERKPEQTTTFEKKNKQK